MQLRVSDNSRYLVYQDGTPFFYLADTAWRLFRAIKLDEVRYYMEDRVQKGFTVIQAIIIYEYFESENAEIDNYSECKVLPLQNKDPSRPNEAYFKHVDEVIAIAEELGLVLALSPAWGDQVVPNPWDAKMAARHPAIFNIDNAYVYGKFLGERYKDKPIIWVLGGDRPADGVEDIWHSMARGLKEGEGSDGNHLMTFHTCWDPNMVPIPSSSTWFHHDEWLDFNMIQSGHRWDTKNFKYVSHDYNLLPVKPVIDGEPRYENIVETFWDEDGKRITPFKVRQAAYWAVLSGTAGHTYGCNDVWQFYDVEKQRRYLATTPWRIALQNDGARQMSIMKQLITDRPWYKMVPDQKLVASKHREDDGHIRAARAADSSFSVIYLPLGGAVEIRMDRLSGNRYQASWFNPRNGEWLPGEQCSNKGIAVFQAPDAKSDQDPDWVLVLDKV